MEGDPIVERKQPLQRLRRWLHQNLSIWIQQLDPAPAEVVTPLSSPLESAGAVLADAPVRPHEFHKVAPAIPLPMSNDPASEQALVFPVDPAALCPGLREPLSVEQAVLARDMTLLKREAADALAALGAAHALVTSARMAQVQHLRPQVEKGQIPEDALKALAADYQGWQNDQVRLFDALALVVRMQVPQGLVLEQVDPALQEQAKQHLASLSVEYQRRQLMHQHKRQG